MATETETELGSDRDERLGPKTSGRASARLWVAAGLASIALVGSSFSSNCSYST